MLAATSLLGVVGDGAGYPPEAGAQVRILPGAPSLHDRLPGLFPQVGAGFVGEWWPVGDRCQRSWKGSRGMVRGMNQRSAYAGRVGGSGGTLLDGYVHGG